MLRSLKAIAAYRSGDPASLGQHSWLQLLASAEERVVNYERIESLEELQGQVNPVLDYVERSLRLLEAMQLSFWVKELVEQVLIWAETAKGGTLRQRLAWQAHGINLFVHNEGSAQLYARYGRGEGAARQRLREGIPDPIEADQTKDIVVERLIATHGLIGQYIRGEVPFSAHEPLIELVEKGYLSADELDSVLLPLNACIIGAVDLALWERVQPEVKQLICSIAAGEREVAWTIRERLMRLRSASIEGGEAFGQAFAQLEQIEGVIPALADMQDKTLWYVESALQNFSLEEVVKIFLLALRHSDVSGTAVSDSVVSGSTGLDLTELETKPQSQEHAVSLNDRHGAEASFMNNSAYAADEFTGRWSQQLRHISFELFMNMIYYDYKGQKHINVYKKRMIEKFLRELSWEEILNGQQPDNPHLHYQLKQPPSLSDTVFVNFEFSPAANKLIEFCIEAEKTPLYEQAVLLLFDLFDLRRDAYDRFHNEERYLADMNQTVDYKRVMLDYISGTRVLDIGPGGGVLLDLIEQELPDVQAVGIDISTNVIEALERKKQLEGHQWQVMKGDALQLESSIEPGSVDTIIFSSILHELYSYIERDGHKFNLLTVADALRSAYRVLAPGGRIIIRDGIMTEPLEQRRRIRFLEADGVRWLERYAKDFAGRKIEYTVLGDDEVELPVNDAMEFLYTYTWGAEAYVHEVQEQFGYLTPSGYRKFIHETLGEEAGILVAEHYLQAGYTEALQERIDLRDEKANPVPLPDSTCLWVIEKPTK
ncbi:class I SAM-dependent methyltransferase [Paenibacillus massiliensis]|uniref:class I SAM-dependent methyltransferase n=1 Tax=Paenibacillus massiliensis TaxID=225917 RepID=UPI000375381B|nr:class I SAM-dependent methyltransferase [Paenibacillus massiliensis]